MSGTNPVILQLSQFDKLQEISAEIPQHIWSFLGCNWECLIGGVFLLLSHLSVASPADKQHQEAKVPVAIKVVDVNDNAPKFAEAYEAFVCETARSNQVWPVHLCAHLCAHLLCPPLLCAHHLPLPTILLCPTFPVPTIFPLPTTVLCPLLCAHHLPVPVTFLFQLPSSSYHLPVPTLFPAPSLIPTLLCCHHFIHAHHLPFSHHLPCSHSLPLSTTSLFPHLPAHTALPAGCWPSFVLSAPMRGNKWTFVLRFWPESLEHPERQFLSCYQQLSSALCMEWDQCWLRVPPSTRAVELAEGSFPSYEAAFDIMELLSVLWEESQCGACRV